MLAAAALIAAVPTASAAPPPVGATSAAGATPFGAAVTPVEGAWGARSSDALPVSFEVKDGKVVNARFTFTWGFCGEFESALPNEEAIHADGSWAFLDNRGPKIEATFVAPDLVEGTIVAPSRELPGCPKTEATFSGAPGPVPPAPPIRIADGRGHLTAKPRRIDLHLAAVRYVYELRWTTIGPAGARATGTALIRTHGRTLRRPVTIALGRPLERAGYRTFQRLSYTLRGKLPHGVARYGATIARK